MISINILFSLLLIHFLADFGMQTHEQATKKGESNEWLTYHVSVYSIIWFIFIMSISNNFELSIAFTAITFICHYITDWITSRIGKPFWKNNDFHNGFVVVGFDQMMHIIQLVLTFNILFG